MTHEPSLPAPRRARRVAAIALGMAVLCAAPGWLPADTTGDERIELRIRNKLAGLVSVHLENFAIEVRDGAVRLTGSVASIGERANVERVVGGLAGVTSISNELTVRAADRSEAAVADDVRRLLERRMRFRRTPIEVSVSGAEVRLGGKVERAVDRLDAESIASEVAGVSRVRNEIQVVSREPVAPEEIRRRVLGVLGNPLTFGVIRNLEVSVEEGVVVLKGVAGREADRSQAERLAMGVIGVVSVRNLITVAGP